MKLQNLYFLWLLSTFLSCSAQTEEKSNYPKIVKSFKAVSIAPDFDTTLVSQYIRSIFQDSDDNLWFGTLGEGLVRYDKKTLTYFGTKEGFISNSVFAINEDKNGNMWIGTDQGVYKYNGDKFRKYAEKDGLFHTDISRKSILVDNKGDVWVGTHHGLYKYNPEAEKTGNKSFSLFEKIPVINVAGIHEAKNGDIWVASSDEGVFKYDRKSTVNYKQKEKLSENYAGGIAEDKNGNIWFTFKNGITKFDGKTFTDITPKDGLGGTEFWGILIEKSGIIWITARGSTTRFDPSLSLPNPKAFTVFTPADGHNCCVQSMFQAKSGNVWWGTGQGLYNYDGKKFFQVKKIGPWKI